MSRPGRGRWWCCCTASPSSGTGGGSRSGRWRRRRIPGGGPRHARLQPVLHAGRRPRLRHPPAGRRHRRPDPRARRRVRDAGRARLGRVGRLGHRDGLPRGGGPAGHLERGPPAQAGAGTAPPGQLRKSWYFFFFDLPDLPGTVVHAGRWHFFRHLLHDASPAYTPEEMDRYLRAWSQPGAATGMINYYRPRCGPRPNRPKRRSGPSRRPRWSSGGRPIATSVRNSPSPTTTTCPASTASSVCPTPRTGCIHDEAERVTHLLTGFFAPALAR